MFGDESTTEEFESVIATIEGFRAIISPEYGAVLYSTQAKHSTLPDNLHAAVLATSLGLKSVDYANRTYVEQDSDDARDTAVDPYMQAIQRAGQVRLTLARRVTSDEDDHYGRLAAAVALQRLSSGFHAAQVLYRLGLNLEGDAVSRQILEQIGWALQACSLHDLVRIKRLKATVMSALKRMLPIAGALYGRLSATTHARLQQHRAHFEIGSDERGAVVLAKTQLSIAARLILTLTDSWAVAFEMNESRNLEVFDFLVSPDSLTPDPERSFLAEAEALVRRIEAFEQTVT
jgi:hypothetical protein